MQRSRTLLQDVRANAAAAISGLLLSLCFPPFAYWGLAFVALLPLLWAITEAEGPKAASNLGAITGLVFYAWGLYWLRVVFSPWVAFAFWCIFALWLALFSALFFVLWRRRLSAALGWRALGWVGLAGALWVGPEFFRSEVWWLNNAWLALGYALVPAAGLLQAASWIGVYGLSALLVAVNVALLLALKRGVRAPAAALGVLLALLALWGNQRSHRDWSAEGRPLAVALLQDESLNVEKLGRLSRSPEVKGADLVVWPEYTVERPVGRDAQTARTLASALKGAPLAIVGSYDHPDDLTKKSQRWMNEALVVEASTGSAQVLGPSYGKHHPIPVVEHYLPANKDPRPVDTRLGRLGLQICYDLDFEDGARKVAALGAEVLLVPNMDPLEWGAKQHAQHSAMASLRAVETGLWIGRAASSGVSQIIDPSGRVRASLPMSSVSGVLRGELRLRAARTVYTRIGYWVGPLSLLLSLVFLAVWGTRRRSRA